MAKRNVPGQRRQLIDARQLFELYRDTDIIRRHSCRGSMRWRTISGREYLYHNVSQSKRSLGPRSAETERILEDFTSQSLRVQERLRKLKERIKAMAPLNRAMGIGRVPTLAARILRSSMKLVCWDDTCSSLALMLCLLTRPRQASSSVPA